MRCAQWMMDKFRKDIWRKAYNMLIVLTAMAKNSYLLKD